MAGITEQDIYSVADYMHMEIGEEDVNYIKERYDDYASSGGEMLWVEIVEQMIYELKDNT